MLDYESKEGLTVMATTPALPPEIKESKTFEITVTEFRARQNQLISIAARVTVVDGTHAGFTAPAAYVNPNAETFSGNDRMSIKLSPTAVPIYVSHLFNEIEDLTNQQTALKIKENAVRAEIAQLSSVKED